MMQPTCSIQGSLTSLCAILFTQLIVIITIILCSPITFLCLLSPSFKNCRFEKNDFKVEENGNSKNACKLSNKDSDFIG